MCVWGKAAALGPNINAPMDSASEQRAIAATRRGLALIDARPKGDREAAWIRALATRFLDGTASTRAGRDSAYATAMAVIADKSPHDVDALSLAAEAAMDLTPWTYWSKEGLAGAGTPRMLRWLERGLQLAPNHPGACHFYNYAFEAVHPERTVRCAERLAALMPGAGHIVHMLAHIYIRVGRWADAIEISKHAVHADKEYFERPHTPDAGFYWAAYRSHNHHFLTLAAVMAEASATALDASRQVVQIVTPDVARVAPPVQPMLAVPMQTLLSFGRWDEVLRTTLPPSDLQRFLFATRLVAGADGPGTHGRGGRGRAPVRHGLALGRRRHPGVAHAEGHRVPTRLEGKGHDGAVSAKLRHVFRGIGQADAAVRRAGKVIRRPIHRGRELRRPRTSVPLG